MCDSQNLSMTSWDVNFGGDGATDILAILGVNRAWWRI